MDVPYQPYPFLAFKGLADAVKTTEEDHTFDDEDALVPYLGLAFLVDLVLRRKASPVRGTPMMPDDVLPAPFLAMEALVTTAANLEPADDDDDVIAEGMHGIVNLVLAAVAVVTAPFAHETMKRTSSREQLAAASVAGNRLFTRRASKTVRLRNAL